MRNRRWRLKPHLFTTITRQDIEIDNAEFLRYLPPYEQSRLVSQLTDEANEIREAIDRENASRYRTGVETFARMREKRQRTTVI